MIDKAMIAAGELADVAGRIVGVDLNFSKAPCNAMHLGPLLELLREKVEAYNEAIRSAHRGDHG